MLEALKEELKNSLKEMEEKTNNKLEEINKSLKENQEKHNQTDERHFCAKVPGQGNSRVTGYILMEAMGKRIMKIKEFFFKETNKFGN